MKLMEMLTGCCLIFLCAATNAAFAAPFTPSVLNSKSNLYNGKIVRVRGYLILAPESHVLYESRELIEQERKEFAVARGKIDLKSRIKYCLTVANSGFFYKNSSALNGRTVVLSGTFVDDYLNGRVNDPGACVAPTAIYVDIDQFKRDYPARYR